MSRNTGSVASSNTSWLKLYAAVAVLPLALTACGGGGGGDSPAPPPPAPTPAPTPPSPAPTPTTAGTTWTNVTTAAAGNLLGVDYDDGHFVAVSDTGGAITSTDGSTWTPTAIFTSNVQTDHLKANAISHLGTTLVAGGSTSSSPYTTSTGVVASSTDGVTWTAATLPAGATPIHGFISGTNIIALGEAGAIYSSTDGRTYTALPAIPHAGALNAGAYNGTQYVGVGDSGYVIASMNGTTWGSGQVFVGINMHGVAWTGTQFVAVGDNGSISVSPNGTNWSALKTSAISGALRSVAVSSSGLITVVGDNGIETSPDGSTWTARNASGVAALSGVVFGNGEFVAVGASSAIKTSNN